MRKHAIRLVALVAVLTACVSDTTEPVSDTTEPTVSTEPVSDITEPTLSSGFGTLVDSPIGSEGDNPIRPIGLFGSQLVDFETCDAFLNHVKRVATEQVGPWGFESEGWFVASTVTAATTTAASRQDSVGASMLRPGVDYSATNVQELDVDEPDIVKTDGKRILALTGGILYYIDVSPGPPELVSGLPLLSWGTTDLWYHQMFMSGDTALVLASTHSDGGRVTSLVLQIDLSEPERMRVANTLVVDGELIAARLVGDRVALALTFEPMLSDEFDYSASHSEPEKSRAKEINRQVIAESTLEDWAPRYVLNRGPDEPATRGVMIDCSAAYAPEEFPGTAVVSVLTFDMTEAIDVESVASVMSGGDTVYASTDRLYVANHRWIDRYDSDDEDISRLTTHIHRFGIGGVEGPVYEASGSVEGFLLDQFAMSEHDGYLRVASTSAPPWRWGDEESDSRVDVLERNAKELRVVGSVGGLGRGERIYAVRFMGDVGYVVTFRETDPLYTIDLSDPPDPKVVGELKILGYSAYLHPIGDGLLLGVGQDADEEGRIMGTQVSIFDVSDLANPVRTHQLTLPESSFSDVEFDHRAFLYWPPTGIAVLPIGWWEYDEESDVWEDFHQAMVIDVGPEGMEQRGSIEHEVDLSDGDTLYYGGMGPLPIERSLVVGETLFTLSAAGLKGSDLESLSATSWIRFPLEEYIGN